MLHFKPKLAWTFLTYFLIYRYYLLSLIQGEDNNLSVFRVISLWLENSTLEFEDKQDGSFKQLLCGVPSRKYLPVLPQLAPRLTADKKQFGPNLITILSKFITILIKLITILNKFIPILYIFK